MKKIDKLTIEQEKQIKVYLDKWLSIGRSTKRIEKEKAIESINFLYKICGYKKPKEILFFNSPLEMELAVNKLKGSNLGSNLESNLWSNLGSNLESNLWSNLGSNLWSNLGSNLWSNLGSNLESNLWSNLRSNLESNLWSNLESNKIQYESIYFANYWTYWIGFYDYILNELFPEEKNKYKDFQNLINQIQNLHCFIPFKDKVFVSDNPIELNLNSNGQLHHDRRPAMLYKDGYALYYNNGVELSKEQIEKMKHICEFDKKMDELLK